jgi:deoxyribonuclease-4
MMKLGAHNSIAGGHANAVAECLAIGGEAFQIFCKNQRQWTAKPLAAAEAKAFHDAVVAAKVGPGMVHGAYLVNLGNPQEGPRAQSAAAFMDELHRTEQLGIPYLNIHPGSHLDADKKRRDDPKVRAAALDRIATEVAKALDATSGSRVKVVFENAAGQGTNVGNSWEELAHLIEAVGSSRLGVTIDTQHSWACGYDWVGRYDEVWDAFDAAVGRKWLVAFHLNDSKEPCGARVDRHDTIGQGQLGLEFFGRLVNDKRTDGLLGILETPDGPESWKREIALLRSLRKA